MAGYACASCGAPLEIKNRFSKVVICAYCGSHLKISDGGFDIAGRQAKLAEFPSLLSVGCRGSMLGKPFVAHGRLRYKYQGGFFDEWYIEYDGEPAWFAEDEGTYTLFTEMTQVADVPADLGDVRAGANIMMGGRRVMIKEKGRAVIEGGEGELFHYFEPGEEVSYIDGICDGKKTSIEWTEDEVELFTGRVLLKRDITIEG
jgi:hypothetical protein